jgi:hypothetical protein
MRKSWVSSFEQPGVRLRQINPLVKSCVYGYVLHLLGRYEFTTEFLTFVFGILGQAERYKLIRFVHERQTPEAAGKLPGKLLALADADDLARDIRNKTITDKSRIRRRDIEEFLYRAVFAKHLKYHGNTSSRRVRNLQALFRLDPVDIKIVCLLYCYAEVPNFELFCDRHKSGTLLKFIALATNERLPVIQRAMSAGGTLRKAGILTAEKGNALPFNLDNEIREYLSGFSGQPLVEKFCRKDKGLTHTLDQFNVPLQARQTIQALLKADAPCNILLYGQAGTGKTEFARSLAFAIGQQAYFVQYADTEVGHRQPNRRMAIQATVGAIHRDRGVLVVDEADSFLNTRYFTLGSGNYSGSQESEFRIQNESVTGDRKWLSPKQSACRLFSGGIPSDS